MSYGSTAYGSAALGGSAASEWQTFFPYFVRDPDITYEARATFSGTSSFYSLFTQQSSEPGSGSAGVLYKVYTATGEGETPQLQATQEGNGQIVIGAAPFITVTVIINGVTWAGGQAFSVRGRPGD